MHSKDMYAKHIREWLNFEWKRLEKGEVEGFCVKSGLVVSIDDPFQDATMRLVSPKGKHSFLFVL